MATYTLGKDGKLYLFDYGGRLFTAVSATPNDYSTPALITTGATLNTDYAIYGNCRDVTLSLDTETEEITAREDGGFRTTIPTVKNSTIEFEARWKKNDTFFEWLTDAWAASGEIAVMAMDGVWNTAGNSGLVGNFTVTGFSRSEPISGVMSSSITLEGSSYISWYKHSA